MFNWGRTIFKCVCRCFILHSELPFFLRMCKTIILRFFSSFFLNFQVHPSFSVHIWIVCLCKNAAWKRIKFRLIPDLAQTVKRWLTSLSISEIRVLCLLIKLNYFLLSSYFAASLLSQPVRSLINIFRIMKVRMLCHLDKLSPRCCFIFSVSCSVVYKFVFYLHSATSVLCDLSWLCPYCSYWKSLLYMIQTVLRGSAWWCCWQNSLPDYVWAVWSGSISW